MAARHARLALYVPIFTCFWLSALHWRLLWRLQSSPVHSANSNSNSNSDPNSLSPGPRRAERRARARTAKTSIKRRGLSSGVNQKLNGPKVRRKSKRIHIKWSQMNHPATTRRRQIQFDDNGSKSSPASRKLAAADTFQLGHSPIPALTLTPTITQTTTLTRTPTRAPRLSFRPILNGRSAFVPLTFSRFG